MDPSTDKTDAFWRGNPLVPAAAIFLLGVAAGLARAWPAGPLLAMCGLAWLAWVGGEWARRKWIAHAALALLLAAAGALTAVLNQQYTEPEHVARLAGDQPLMVALKARVEIPPGTAESHGNQYWVAHVEEIWTQQGWIASQGDILVQWGGAGRMELRRGMEVELYGWLSRPEPALNPGAYDPRKALAADRVFAQIRVPRATGVVLLDDARATGTAWLSRMRLFLRAKLLEHTIQQDVPAALTLTALLLGYRDPAIADVSQSFANAGIAHLLAISGSHIVFFTAMVWAILRFLPIRPRRREWLIAGIVFLYVLATPCGPPIVRAAAALLMVLLARMLGRPRAYLNMLAGAAAVVVLLRPTDIADAGFQLSFVTTAGLILFSSRIHAALFEQRLARETLAAELGGTRWARWRLRILRTGAALLVANAIGAATALPLVALHFGQINLWAILSGIIAIPFVSAAMVVAAMQLLLSLAGPGAWFGPLAALCGRAMIWIVAKLAALPGAAVALRPPPVWVVVAMYGVLVLWAMRRRLGVSRAAVTNAALVSLVAAAGWYAWSQPVQGVHVTVLSAGEGDCLLIHTSRGMWAIDAGTPQGSSVVDGAIRPALRLAGVRQLNGQILRAFDTPHGREAGIMMETFRPLESYVAADGWQKKGQTLAGAEVAAAAEEFAIPVRPLTAGDTLTLAPDCRVEVLWPPAGKDAAQSLMLRLVCGNQRLLIVDPKSETALALPADSLRCDAIIFTGPRRGTADAFAVRRARELGAKETIWCGRGSWAPPQLANDEWNTVEGAVEVDLSGSRTQVARTR